MALRSLFLVMIALTLSVQAVQFTEEEVKGLLGKVSFEHKEREIKETNRLKSKDEPKINLINATLAASRGACKYFSDCLHDVDRNDKNHVGQKIEHAIKNIQKDQRLNTSDVPFDITEDMQQKLRNAFTTQTGMIDQQYIIDRLKPFKLETYANYFAHLEGIDIDDHGDLKQHLDGYFESLNNHRSYFNAVCSDCGEMYIMKNKRQIYEAFGLKQ